MLFSRRALLTAAVVAPLAGCGFKLRGRFTLPFETVYLDMQRNTPMAAQIARQLRGGSNAKLVDSPEAAQAILKVIRVSRERSILSKNAKGVAREYLLRLTVTFKVTAPDGSEYLPQTSITAERSLMYDDTEYLSRDSEEALFYNEMQSDIVSQLRRRIERAQVSAKEA